MINHETHPTLFRMIWHKVKTDFQLKDLNRVLQRTSKGVKGIYQDVFGKSMLINIETIDQVEKELLERLEEQGKYLAVLAPCAIAMRHAIENVLKDGKVLNKTFIKQIQDAQQSLEVIENLYLNLRSEEDEQDMEAYAYMIAEVLVYGSIPKNRKRFEGLLTKIKKES